MTTTTTTTTTTKVTLWVWCVLALWCWASLPPGCKADTIVWGGSSMLTYAGSAQGALVEESMRRGSVLAFSASNARTDKLGALVYHNLATLFINDDSNTTTVEANTFGLLAMNQSQFFGFLPASDAEGAAVTFYVMDALGVDTIPFVGPWSGLSLLQNPFQRWIMNTLPTSFLSLTYAFIKFLANEKLLSRFALYYPAPSLISGVDIRAGVETSLGDLGLRLVSYYAAPSFLADNASVAAAVANISIGQPQAVIMVVAGVQISPFIRAAKSVMDSSVIYVLDGSTAFNVTQELTTNPERENVYLVSPVPLLSDTSFAVVNEFWADQAAYDPTWEGIIQPGALVGYINARWVASVFETMRGSAFPTRAAFMDAVYQTPILDVGGVFLGPFFDDCSQTGYLACCNAGARTIYLAQFPNGTLEYVPNSDLTWQTCFPQPSDVQLPFKFGESASFTGSDQLAGTSIRQGLTTSFASINSAGSFNGRQMVLISYDDKSLPLTYGASNYQQLESLDGVLALLGIDGYQSLALALNNTDLPVIGVSSGSPSLNTGFDRRLVSITGSSYEEIAGALDYFVSTMGLSSIGIYYEATADGQLTRDGLVKALALQGLNLQADWQHGQSAAPSAHPDVWLIYNPTGELVPPFLQSLPSPVPLSCVLSSVDPDQLAANLTKADLSTVHFTQALPNPNPSAQEVADLAISNSTAQLIASYTAALGAGAKPGYLSLSGYVSGMLLSSAISTINGQVTSDSLLSAIYNSGTFDLGGLQLGVYYDNCNVTGIPCCNKGTRSVHLVTADTNGTWTTQHTFDYQQCEFTFDSTASAGGGGLSSSMIAVIAILVPVGVIFLLILAVCGMLALWVYTRRRGQDDWEINFEELEMGPLLGQGGFGEVYRAQWRGTEVAVKILHPNATRSREQRDAFLEETRVMSQLRHPNVILFMGSCRNPQPCIVMEYMLLGSLYDLLHNELMSEIPMVLKLKMMYQAAKGMHFLHSSGIVHRDLKSLNLLLDNKWNLKVCDFGLTRVKDSMKKRSDDSDSLVCSIPWTAPEVLEESLDIDYNLADVYSFGVILWEVLTRRAPYEGFSPAQVAVAVIREDLRPSLGELEDSLEEETQQYTDLIRSCWQRDPVGRPVFLDIMNAIQRISTVHGNLSFSSKTSTSNSSSSSGSARSASTGGPRKHTGSGSGSRPSDNDVSDGSSSPGKGRPPSAARRDVSFVVCDLARFNEVWRTEPAAAERAVEQYVQIIRETCRQHRGHVFSPSSLHSGGTVMISFVRPRDAALFAVKVQGEVARTKWSLTGGGIRSRVSIHYGAGVCPPPPDDQMRLSYQEKTYQEALRINIFCPSGAALCSTAFEAALKAAGQATTAGDDLTPLRCCRFDAERQCFRVVLEEDDESEDENDRSTSVGSMENVRDTELGICSSNRCTWIVDSKEITLGAPLGQGNYGRVTKGVYKGTPVAIKRLFASRLDDATMRKMRREAAILSGLTHPNVVQLVGLSITDGGNLLLVMELVQRGSLYDLLADGSVKLSWERKLAMLRDAAVGIHFLHQNGIIHRDIKSSNLLVDENWNVKVGDFGFATAKQDNCTMTRCGTPAWTAPEILSPPSGDRATYDEKADVYSFGIVMWEVLTRNKPYQDKTTVTVAVDVINGQRPTIPASADKAYAALMRKCWAASPHKRPSIDEVLVYFNSALDDGQRL